MDNDYEVRGMVAAIIINSPKCGRLEAIISTNKLERAKEWVGSWHISCCKSTKTFYVAGNMATDSGSTSIALHRWITDVQKGTLIDHYNHDGLDITDDNLRFATSSENQQNRKSAQINNKASGIRGISWHNRDKLWFARISLNGKCINVGYFKDIADAENAVKSARAKHMPFSKEVA